MTYRINLATPPGKGWVRLPVDQPKSTGLFSAVRGRNTGHDLTGWAATAARDLLGPPADPEALSAQTENLARLASDARERGAKLACAWIQAEPAGTVAQLNVSTIHRARQQPAPQLDALEELFARRDAKTTELEVSRVELPAGPAVRLRREWYEEGGSTPADAVVSVTYVCRPPQIKDAIVYMMYWVLADDDPLFTEIADSLAETLRIIT